ncbi:DUF6716 putative glycosyltransferase [Luteimicrobium sp. NPDC057192]|uniref:DUF6716 putative glycosyltransferase n=1 Tax=Luteimicrobium sp. NPDC057192 TaxID=3346042 RepID=UPI003636EEBB
MTAHPRSALLLLAYDSQLRWARALGAALEAQGWTCRYAAPSDVRSFVDPELERSLGVYLERAPWAELVQRAGASDALVLALQGPLTSRFVQDLAATGDGGVRPVVVTGWVGVIIEKLVAGYLERFASDVVAVNSREDLRSFEAAGAHLGLPTDNLLLSGLPLLPSRPASPRRGPVRTVLFADQPTVPSSRAERLYLYERLVEHARRHPERRVLVKPRHRPDEDPYQTVRHHPAELLADADLPANLEIVYEPLPELLPEVDLVLTVSSTAGLEAVGAGVRTVFVADLGVHENLGNHVLLPSGLVRTLDVLEGRDEDLPEPDQAWLADWFVGEPGRPGVGLVAERVDELTGVPPADRPFARTTATATFRARVAVARHRKHDLPAGGLPGHRSASSSVRTVRWRQGVRGRVLLACHAVLPTGWQDWPLVDRLRRA